MMASTSNNDGLHSLLGEELYKDYYENEQGGVGNYVGGSNLCDVSPDVQACALEQLVDSLLMDASKEYEQSIVKNNHTLQQKVTSHSQPSKTTSRFATPKTGEDVDKAVAMRIPKNTQTDTNIGLSYGKSGPFSEIP